jgi:hypothetical protein
MRIRRSLATTWNVHRPHADAREERGELVEVFTLPAIVGMIVALGALDLHAEEDAGDLGGRLLGAAFLGHDDCGRAVLADIARGGDELLGDVVPGDVLVQAIAEIRFQGVGRDEGPLFDAAIEDHVAPVAGPVEAVLRVGKQFADQSGALVGRLIEREGDDVLWRRNVADDVEPCPPEEGGVVAPRGDGDALDQDFLGERFVDLPGHLRCLRLSGVRGAVAGRKQ